MGIWSRARLAYDWLTLSGSYAPAADPTPAGATQFGTDYMPVDQMWQEMFGGQNGPVSREQMFRVPGVIRARDMICVIATLPLEELTSDNKPVSNPLLEQFDPDVPNVVHLAQTVEDLFCDSISWWEIIADRAGRPTSVKRRAPESVTLQPKNDDKMPAPLPSGYDPRGATLYVDGRAVPASRMIRFDSPRQPARVVCADAIRQATDFAEAASMYARNPRPLDYFTTRMDGQPDPAPGLIKAFLNQWRAFRKRFSTGYVPAAYKYEQVEAPTPVNLQLVELSEFVTKQLAISLGLEAEDVGVNVTSRVYANVIDRRQDRINDLLGFFMRAIGDRLTMPDVTPRGHRVVFKLDEFLKANPTDRWNVYQVGSSIGALTVDEIRAEEGLPELPAAARPRPAVTTPSAAAGTNVRQLPARVAAGADVTHTFADDRVEQVPLEVTGFAVDVQRRTISGRALPYGTDKIGVKMFRRFRFQQGALVMPSDVRRVKLTEDHNYALAFGRAEVLNDGADGLDIVMKVGRGAHGDRMLELAADGIKDGLSVGVDLTYADMVPDPDNQGVTLVRAGAVLREIALLAIPAFDDARVTSVAAGADNTEGQPAMPPEATATTPPAAQPAATTATPDPAAQPASFPPDQVQLTADDYAALQALIRPPAALPNATANPLPGHLEAGAAQPVRVKEPLPYAVAFSGDGEQFLPIADHRALQAGQAFDFCTDITAIYRSGDYNWDTNGGAVTPAGKRVQGFLAETFAQVVTTDVDELNPTINRQDMYVDQRDYKFPLWESVNKGAPPNGVQPFKFPKFNSSSGLVGDHTEGTEPAGGAFTTTSQTVTPTALSGAVDITRETFDMGGNPAVSTLIWNQMRRAWREGLESATATFLNTLTAATDIALGVAPTDAVLIAAWESALVDLQFIRGYDFDMFGIEKALYKKFSQAKYSSGEPAYPMLNPQNRNGTAASRFRQLDLNGVTGTPAWALASVADASNNSWLFDRTVVSGWATAPQRLEFAGIDSDGDYAPVAMIRIAGWGYKAFACTDIAGVRQVTYDATA